MTQPTGKTYLPTAVVQAKQLCTFLSRHGATIVAATTLLSPSDAAAMSAGIASYQTFCQLLEKIEGLYDPFYGKEQARAEP